MPEFRPVLIAAVDIGSPMAGNLAWAVLPNMRTGTDIPQLVTLVAEALKERQAYECYERFGFAPSEATHGDQLRSSAPWAFRGWDARRRSERHPRAPIVSNPIDPGSGTTAGNPRLESAALKLKPGSGLSTPNCHVDASR